jgi:crotonobetainyl-CoA:carnitine CoA-transferase CaiB-like acyl-CoA transferase
MGVANGLFYAAHRSSRYITIHAARAGGDGQLNKLAKLTDVSIHAARAGGDGQLNKLAKLIVEC